ncbi:hypothetical protein [Aromatoleum aromaticum]|uniref:hypothetical protein n=1 Tax=Aromatoleum aromaticum TaxID=551760 RepID=UPI00059FAD64|nr:hypothetical protein [Aromatoleum aromaticum]NMG54019.1 hypothetical protein [Aromatoleum aromaticum]
MNQILKLLLLLCMIVTLGTGCAINRATAHTDPATDLSTLKTMHVKKFADDNANTDALIADRLRSKGISVTTDADTRPGKVDATVTYVEKWMWDITMYMLELTVVIREPESDFPLASGNSYHTSLTRKSPGEMANEVIDNIYKGQNK